METLSLHDSMLMEEIFPVPKSEVQVMIRVNPESKSTFIPNFEIFTDCFVGGSRDRTKERKLSPGMIRFLSAVMKVSPEVKVRWILAEWNSVIVRGNEFTIKRLLQHDQVVDYKYNLRMQSVMLD